MATEMPSGRRCGEARLFIALVALQPGEEAQTRQRHLETRVKRALMAREAPLGALT